MEKDFTHCFLANVSKAVQETVAVKITMTFVVS